MRANNYFNPSEAFFGRRRDKSLKKNHIHLVENRLPIWKVNLDSIPPTPLERLFSVTVHQVRLEIGFGRGEHLIQRAVEMPDSGFIGIEPFVSSMAKCIKHLEELELQNIRLYDDNAIHLLDWLPDDCIDAIYLLYPDPWPKKRHWKRRFVSQENLNRFSRVLKKDGMLYCCSDIDNYINWMLFYFQRHSSFQWVAEESSDWLNPFPGWIPTHYEKKAQSEGRTTAYLTFQRI
ncbi:tRNA (guanosine(46)-N7)-methyltransferase TrmB [Candidatus Liberibacter sp.]|uniref:tRNA (guanosine(46)-N7)-methyltransferase TrmB n=1 Tax=Candidatus Liberibacter sp. TaxID=34022 RepID=UPI0015F4B2DC|nr:tRNA (guanosine(46)-N7)-methyltransferase TrmB [Candidatus Liberibacter sp.]MBA5724107.1 tRNA (guanosine(46)-N7)-methyltransferase TrmB [Candidatus Liberibacter sp.]